MICGDRDGFVYFFKRNEDGTLAKGEKIKSAGTEIDILNNSAPELSDLNGDGLLDLLVGTQSTGNYLYIYYNTGTKTAPEFGSFNFLLNKGMFVSIGNAAPELFDIDGDGVKDLISGNSVGDILYYHNSGTNSAMVLDDPISFDVEGSPMKVDKYSSFCFTDWNNDGVIDMVVGDKNEKVMLFLGKGDVAVTNTTEKSASISVAASGGMLSFTGLQKGGQLELLSLRGQRVATLAVNASVVALPESVSKGVYLLRGVLDSQQFSQKISIK